MTITRLIGLILLGTALGACGSSGDETAEDAPLVQSDDGPGHVHALAVDPADDSVIIASHSGLFRAARGAESATRIGEERRDVMGFTVVGPRRYAGSGHPDFRTGGPPLVGFIRSDDAGRTWRTVSLEGEADLHALEVRGQRVWGYDATNQHLRVSRDGGRTWRSATVPPLLDIAVDPEDSEVIIASAEDRLLRSTDGGRRFRTLVGDVPPSHLVWSRGELLAFGLDGRVRAIEGRTARPIGTLHAPPAAATVDGTTVLVSLDDGTVLQSRNGGRAWTRRLAPPTG